MQPTSSTQSPKNSADVPDTLADTRRCRALLGMVPTTDLPALVRRQAGADPGYCQAPMMTPASAAATT